MVKIAVVDDDIYNLKETCNTINKIYEKDKIIDAYDDSTSFFKCLNKCDYDIVFLDIEMPNMNGFELADKINSFKCDTKVFFISNFEHLVFKSFSFKPMGFIRKSSIMEDITLALKFYDKEQFEQNDVCLLHIDNNDKFFKFNNILYFESMRHDIYVVTTEGKFKLRNMKNDRYSISSLAVQYELKGFIRIQRSYLVNCNHIYRIKRDVVILKNNFEISINPHNSSEIKQMYQHHLLKGQS